MADCFENLLLDDALPVLSARERAVMLWKHLGQPLDPRVAGLWRRTLRKLAGSAAKKQRHAGNR